MLPSIFVNAFRDCSEVDKQFVWSTIDGTTLPRMILPHHNNANRIELEGYKWGSHGSHGTCR